MENSGFCHVSANHGVVLSPEATQTPFGLLYETLVDGETAETPSLLDDAHYEVDFVVKGTARVLTAEGTLFEARPGDALLTTSTSHLSIANSHESPQTTILRLVFPHDPSAQADIGDVLIRRAEEVELYQLPNQTNRLALAFDPFSTNVPLTFGMEIFEAGHKTPPHIHSEAHEVFVVLTGEGSVFCDSIRQEIHPGDVVVLPPKSLHGIDNDSNDRLYCLEMMFPNQGFAELVLSGTPVGSLTEADRQTLNGIEF